MKIVAVIALWVFVPPALYLVFTWCRDRNERVIRDQTPTWMLDREAALNHFTRKVSP